MQGLSVRLARALNAVARQGLRRPLPRACPCLAPRGGAGAALPARELPPPSAGRHGAAGRRSLLLGGVAQNSADGRRAGSATADLAAAARARRIAATERRAARSRWEEDPGSPSGRGVVRGAEPLVQRSGRSPRSAPKEEMPVLPQDRLVVAGEVLQARREGRSVASEARPVSPAAPGARTLPAAGYLRCGRRYRAIVEALREAKGAARPGLQNSGPLDRAWGGAARSPCPAGLSTAESPVPRSVAARRAPKITARQFEITDRSCTVSPRAPSPFRPRPA